MRRVTAHSITLNQLRRILDRNRECDDTWRLGNETRCRRGDATIARLGTEETLLNAW